MTNEKCPFLIAFCQTKQLFMRRTRPIIEIDKLKLKRFKRKFRESLTNLNSTRINKLYCSLFWEMLTNFLFTAAAASEVDWCLSKKERWRILNFHSNIVSIDVNVSILIQWRCVSGEILFISVCFQSDSTFLRVPKSPYCCNQRH